MLQRVCTSVMPRETFTNDPATDPWATALCTHLPLGGPLPRGRGVLHACSVNPDLSGGRCVSGKTTVWPSLMSTYCVHHSKLSRHALMLSHHHIVSSPSPLPGHSRLTLTTCADILDSGTLFGLSVVTVMWIWAENTADSLNCLS